MPSLMFTSIVVPKGKNVIKSSRKPIFFETLSIINLFLCSIVPMSWYKVEKYTQAKAVVILDT